MPGCGSPTQPAAQPGLRPSWRPAGWSTHHSPQAYRRGGWVGCHHTPQQRPHSKHTGQHCITGRQLLGRRGPPEPATQPRVIAEAGVRPGRPPTTAPGLSGLGAGQAVTAHHSRGLTASHPDNPHPHEPAAHHQAPHARRTQPPTSWAAGPPFRTAPPAGVAPPRQPPAVATSGPGRDRRQQQGSACRGLGSRAVHHKGGGVSSEVDKGVARGRVAPP